MECAVCETPQPTKPPNATVDKYRFENDGNLRKLTRKHLEITREMEEAENLYNIQMSAVRPVQKLLNEFGQKFRDVRNRLRGSRRKIRERKQYLKVLRDSFLNKRNEVFVDEAQDEETANNGKSFSSEDSEHGPPVNIRSSASESDGSSSNGEDDY